MPTFLLMETSGADLKPSLRALALALAEAADGGADVRASRDRLIVVWPDRSGDPAIVEDVVLAASAQLAGGDFDLAGLVGVWGRARLTEAARWAARVLPQVTPGS